MGDTIDVKDAKMRAKFKASNAKFKAKMRAELEAKMRAELEAKMRAELEAKMS